MTIDLFSVMFPFAAKTLAEYACDGELHYMKLTVDNFIARIKEYESIMSKAIEPNQQKLLHQVYDKLPELTVDGDVPSYFPDGKTFFDIFARGLKYKLCADDIVKMVGSVCLALKDYEAYKSAMSTMLGAYDVL